VFDHDRVLRVDRASFGKQRVGARAVSSQPCLACLLHQLGQPVFARHLNRYRIVAVFRIELAGPHKFTLGAPQVISRRFAPAR
jgi:hypothetical protein